MPLYLVPSTPLYDRERCDLPRSVHYVGPCRWDKPEAAPPAPWLAELPRDCPVVYVTEGTMHSKPALLLRAALRGLASLPVRVIATTGTHRDPEDLELGAIPPNARVERWVPHSDLFPRTDVVVTTGGTGTVLAALAEGVPLVVAPTAWDQPENAWRVARPARVSGCRRAGARPSGCATRSVACSATVIPAERATTGGDLAQYGGASQAAICSRTCRPAGRALAS